LMASLPPGAAALAAHTIAITRAESLRAMDHLPLLVTLPL